MNSAHEQLIKSAKLGNVADIDAALAHGADINAIDPASGLAALHHAASRRQFEAFKQLLNRGANANAAYRCGDGQMGSNVLDILVKAVHEPFPALQAMEMALRAGADANVPVMRTTLLHLAAIMGSRPAVDLLLLHGADPMRRNGYGTGEGDLALHTAINTDRRSIEIVFTLARITPDLDAADPSQRSALHIAVERGDEASVCCLLALGASSASVDPASMRERKALACLKWLTRSPLECAVASRVPDVLGEVLRRHDHFEPRQVAAALMIARRRKLAQMQTLLLSWQARQCAREALGFELSTTTP